MRSLLFAAALMIAACNQNATPSAETEAPSSTAEGAAPSTPGASAAPSAAASGPDVVTYRAVCPMFDPGAKVDAVDTRGGVALVFTTNAGDVDNLRDRVRHMGDMYSSYRGHTPMRWYHMDPRGTMISPGLGGRRMGHGGGIGPGRSPHRGMRPHGGMGPHGGRGMGPSAMRGPMPLVSSEVENIDDGARLVLTPLDASELDALRAHVHRQAQRMQSGACWFGRLSPVP